MCKSIEISGYTLSSGVSDTTQKHKYMVIMKAPVKDDDILGSGGHSRGVEKLRDLINAASIDPKDVYVTTLVKCLPPKRNPTLQEIKACSAHIAYELQEIDPEIVITCGTEALRAFNLQTGGVTSKRGQIFTRPFPHAKGLREYKVMPTNDPNALFMNPDPKLEPTVIGDFARARRVVEGQNVDLKHRKTPYTLISTLPQLRKMITEIKDKKFFAFDTESRSLPWSVEPMICFSFCWGYDPNNTKPMAAVVPVYQHDPDGIDWKLKLFWNDKDKNRMFNMLKEIFESPNISQGAHNIKYDINVVRKHSGIQIKGFLFDSMLMHHLWWEHRPHGLEYLADIEFGTGDYSKELHDIVGRGKKLKKTYDYITDEIMWPYAAADAENHFRLTKLYYSCLNHKPHLWKLYCEETEPFLRTLARAEWYGCKLDRDVISELHTEFTNESEKLLKDIRKDTNPEFKPSSVDQVAKELVKLGYGREVRDRRKASGFTTDKTVLQNLEDSVPLAGQVLRYRQLTKLISTYLNNAVNDLDENDLIRINFLIHGTVSGRPSCNFLHQIPRLDHARIKKGLRNLRDMIVAPPGYKFVYGDMSQIELIIFAIQANDIEMLRAFKEDGADIHTATAGAFLGIPDTEVVDYNRSTGKTINFGKVNGSKGKSLLALKYEDKSGNLKPITSGMIAKGFAQLDERFKGAATYFQDVVDEVTSHNGLYISRFGRERHMGSTLNAPNQYMRENAERQAMNNSIQSPAAAVTIRTLNIVEEFLMDKIESGTMLDEDTYPILTVHDSGAWYVKEDLVDWFVPELRRIATRKISELDDYQFTMKIGVGDSWTEAELNAK